MRHEIQAVGRMPAGRSAIARAPKEAEPPAAFRPTRAFAMQVTGPAFFGIRLALIAFRYLVQ